MADVGVQGPSWEQCLDRLYDAVGREQQLAEALGIFRPFFDARGVAFVTLPNAQNPLTLHMGSVGVDEQLLLEYHAHFNVHDEWVLAAQRRPDFKLGAVFRGAQLISRSQMQQTYFYREFLVRYKIRDVLSALVDAGPGDAPTAFLSFYRHQGQASYGADHNRLLSRLAPHLRQVLRLHRRLAPALAVGETLRELVQRLDLPVLFIAADGRIVERNPVAATLLAETLGWLRSLQGGALGVCVAGQWKPLSSLLADLPRAGSLTIDLASADRRCATLDVRLMHGAASDRIAEHPAHAVCTLTRGPRDRAQALRTLFGLTASEARSAVQIAQGRSAAEIGRVGGVAIATVRSQLAAARQKLGVQRLSQMAARVLSM